MPLLKTDATALENIDSWINSNPIDLENGAYLIYFWNYSCNCCRDRLKLFQRIHHQHSEIEVVGIHTPKFNFERDETNLERSIEKLEITHKIAHDPEAEVLSDYNMAYSDQAFVIKQGEIVHQQTPRMETGKLVQKISDILETKEVELNDVDQGKFVQRFLGYSRSSGLNEGPNHPGKKKYSLPEKRKKGHVYLKGSWEQKENYIEPGEGSELRFKTESSEINLVIDPNDGVRDIEVLVNGEPVPEEVAGEDLRVEDGWSYIRTSHPGLYNVVNSDSYTEITLLADKKTRFYALSFN